MIYSHILFDLDGTLVDSSVGIYHSYVEALRLFEREISLEVLQSKIGPPVAEAFKELFPDLFLDPKNLRKVLRGQRKYYRSKGVFESKVYPNIVIMLETLKKRGKILCVATSKPTVFAKKILEHQNLSHYFDVIIGSTLNLSRTKKTDVIAAVLKKFSNIPPEKIVMIGDKKHDIEGAAAHKIDSIGITYGYGSYEEIEKSKPTYVSNTALGLLDILN
ncbi:MAG: HAD hydrolase-like protein [Coxiellaceae bacterium]|nr:HAD hydrolase-like protein [Coxiellaceae bacterium]